VNLITATTLDVMAKSIRVIGTGVPRSFLMLGASIIPPVFIGPVRVLPDKQRYADSGDQDFAGVHPEE
jgi:hypothetical protein